MNSQYAVMLQKIGLSLREAKAYLALIELKESSTGKLIKQSRIPSSKIYNILENLQEKGLVSYRTQNNTKIFMPAPIETIQKLFNERQQRLDKEKQEITTFLTALKQTANTKEPLSHYKYYEGIAGIKSMWNEITNTLSTLPKGTTTKIYTGKQEAYKPLVTFYDEYHKERIKHHINHQAIFPLTDKKTGQRRIKQKAHVRYMPLHNEAEWGIIGSLYFIQYITQKNTASVSHRRPSIRKNLRTSLRTALACSKRISHQIEF